MTTPTISFSHVGIFVRDLDKMASFYERILELTVTDRGLLPGRELAFMSSDPNEHHQVVLATGRTGELSEKVINQISFRVPSLETLRTMYRRLQREPEVSDFRAVNHGNAWTLYFRDPELNRIELFVDSPWYVAQPRADSLDLSLSADEIYRQTEATCLKDPSFMTREAWQDQLRTRFQTRAREAQRKEAKES